jgi:hypothetical protein
MDEAFKRHGLPSDIVADRDLRFQSEFWKTVHDRLGIKLSMSTALLPWSDGQTERANGILEYTLRRFVGPYQTDWDEYLAVAEFAMNNAWNQSIQNTPFMLNFGQHPDTPEVVALRGRNPAVKKFIGKWSYQLARATRCLEAAQQRQNVMAYEIVQQRTRVRFLEARTDLNGNRDIRPSMLRYLDLCMPEYLLRQP